MRSKNPDAYGISAKELAAICHVSERTAARWKSGQTVMPESARFLVRADLGCFHPAWRRWTVRGETLVSPEGWVITMQDVLSSPLLRMQLEAYKTENRDLKASLDNWTEQPLPGEVPEIISVVA